MAVIKKMDLNLDGIPSDLKQQAKQEIANLLIDSTLEYVSRGESPVDGEGSWKELSEDYANREKGGNRTPNMELTGQMLDDFNPTISPPSQNWISVGIRGGESEEKAESHNHLSGKGKNPRRRFIPGEKQTYREDIMREVRRIENEYKQRGEQRQERTQEIRRNVSTQREEISFDLSSEQFVGQDRLLAEISRQLDGR